MVMPKQGLPQTGQPLPLFSSMEKEKEKNKIKIESSPAFDSRLCLKFLEWYIQFSTDKIHTQNKNAERERERELHMCPFQSDEMGIWRF